ncbi:MAG: MBL fold metallo-hydrolase [Firmicutes bacterium]|nr:MBL fold metallo-hydrolase [Bacillota bacterium]
MEFVEVGDGAYCLAGATNIGVLVSVDGDAVLVDSGLDQSIARRCIREVSERGWRVRAVINTHAHADHVGGNAELKRRTSCEVVAPAFEEAWIRYPLSEPLALFVGASPPQGLRNKFTMAEACGVDRVLEPGEHEVFGILFEAVDLKGHSPNQTGVIAGGALFCGDAFFQEEQLHKHVIPYNVDIGAQLDTLAKVPALAAKSVIPGHGGVCRDVNGAVEANVARIRTVTGLALENAGTGGVGAGAEAILDAVCRTLGVAPASLAHYYLLLSAVNAHLSYLESQGLAQPRIEGAALRWRKAGGSQ